MGNVIEPRFVVYGGTSNHGFDARVLDIAKGKLDFFDLEFSHIRYKDFPDGEPGGFLTRRDRIFGSYVIVFSCPFDIEHREELHDIVTACKRQFSAKRVIAVLTFLPFRRQDKQEKTFETTRLRWFLYDLKFWGADHIIICEPHSPSNTVLYCDECGLNVEIADPTSAFAQAISNFVDDVGRKDVVVYSPDLGSVSRAGALAALLGVKMIVTPKKRVDGNTVEVNGEAESEFIRQVFERCPSSVECLFDPRAVSGMHVLMREDEVQTGGTSEKMAWVLRNMGAKSVRLLATHPVCTSGWQDKLVPHGKQQPFDGIFFGNARPRGKGDSDYKESTGGEVQTVDLSPVFADALVRVVNKIKTSPQE
jgi:ribose-phosphate pyrophosphokinase